MAYLNPADNVQRNAITRALMQVRNPPPGTPMPLNAMGGGLSPQQGMANPMQPPGAMGAAPAPMPVQAQATMPTQPGMSPQAGSPGIPQAAGAMPGMPPQGMPPAAPSGTQQMPSQALPPGQQGY